MPDQPSDQPQELLALDNARRALAEAQELGEIKTLRDKFETVRVYARSAAMGLEAQNAAAEMKLRAERKAGHVLADMHLHGGNRRSRRRAAAIRLKQCGITHGQSHRWQREASVSEEGFERYITATRALGKEISTAGLLRLARQHAAQQPEEADAARRLDTGPIVRCVEELVRERLTFGCICVDPPWRAGSARPPKPRISTPSTVNQLVNMFVGRLAGPNAHVHLWTTDEHLHDALRVLTAWGFPHRSCLVWVRHSISFGEYWRPAHDYLLLGVRGKLPYRDNSLLSWIEAPTPCDYRRPEEIRRLIECGSPGPYLELFGQRPRLGWTVLRADGSACNAAEGAGAPETTRRPAAEARRRPATSARLRATVCAATAD